MEKEATIRCGDAAVTAAIFLFLLIGFGGFFLLRDKDTYSPSERRYLAAMPEFSLSALLDGTFTEGVEDFVSDQFPLRGAFVSLDSLKCRWLGNREIGGVYLAADGYLMTRLTGEEVDAALFSRNLAVLQAFSSVCAKELGVTMTVMPIPSASYSLREKLPADAPIYEQETYLAAIAAAFGETFVDLRTVLTDDAYYYRTDHHWTTQGAYAAYVAYCEQMGVPPLRERRFQKTAVTDTFRGTLYAKVLWNGCAYDTVTVYEREVPVRVVADGETLPGMYVPEALDSEDAYAYFFGGNYGELVLTPLTDETSGRRLLVLKDSFANCFLPFLTAHYDEIFVLDLRYWNESVKRYAAEKQVTDILFLYGMDGLMEDRNLAKLAIGLQEELSTEDRYVPQNQGEAYFAKELAEAVLAQYEAFAPYRVVSYGEALYHERFSSLYGCSADRITDGCIAYGEGASADELSILYVPKEEEREAMVRDLERRREARRRDFVGYDPEEEEKAEHGQIAVIGNYVILAICEAPEEVLALCEECLRETR